MQVQWNCTQNTHSDCRLCFVVEFSCRASLKKGLRGLFIFAPHPPSGLESVLSGFQSTTSGVLPNQKCCKNEAHQLTDTVCMLRVTQKNTFNEHSVSEQISLFKAWSIGRPVSPYTTQEIQMSSIRLCGDPHIINAIFTNEMKLCVYNRMGSIWALKKNFISKNFSCSTCIVKA